MISESRVQTSQAFRPSAQQRRLWSSLRPEDQFVAQAALLIEGELQPGRLRRAVEQVVESNDILRTRFVRRPGQRFPLQVVDAEARFSWEETATAAGLQGDLLGQAGLLLAGEREESFDLAAGPVLRVRLLGLGSGRHLLLLSLPALCADGRGLENLVREIGHAYAGTTPG